MLSFSILSIVTLSLVEAGRSVHHGLLGSAFAKSPTAEELLSKPTVEPTAKAPEAQGWKLTPVISGLVRPWGVAWLPDGSMLITEKQGQLRLVKDGKLQPGVIGGLPENIFAGGQGGLMDVVLHPKFADNQLIYLTYSEGTGRDNRTALARARFTGTALEDTKVLFRVSQSKQGGQHFGSRLLFLPDGTMLMSIGDGGNPPSKVDGDFSRKQAQNAKSHLGKVLHMDDEGKPVAATSKLIPDSDPLVYTMGHRNIQGLAMSPDGTVYANEHGARGGDELNVIVPGVNYGWPEVTFSKEYAGPEITDERSRPGMANAVVVWVPSKAPSGLAYYNGKDFPQWQGDLFSGALAGKEIRRVDLDEKGNVVGQQSLSVPYRVRDVRQGPDGGLYILTDEQDGMLMKIEPK